MRLNKTLWVLVTLLISFSVSSYATDKAITITSPVGYWKTIDEVTGNPKSIIQISRNTDQTLTGKVIKLFPSTSNHNPAKTCLSCEGDKHNQPIVGMVILSGLKSNEKQWSNGQILDPENGKTYKCSARLMEQGKKLNVHGYIGLSLFGRSQMWERVDLMSG
jgi:uncharacterized protein (DUF2147 family)